MDTLTSVQRDLVSDSSNMFRLCSASVTSFDRLVDRGVLDGYLALEVQAMPSVSREDSST